MILDISPFNLDEQQLDNLASEFFGVARFPAGEHQIAEITFAAQQPVSGVILGPHAKSTLRTLSLRALSAEEAAAAFEAALETYRRPI